MPEKKKPSRKSSQSRRRSLASSRSAASRRSNFNQPRRGLESVRPFLDGSHPIFRRPGFYRTSVVAGWFRRPVRRPDPNQSAAGQGFAVQFSSSSVATNHEEIRRWGAERGGVPAMVADTGSEQEPGILRIDFPGGAEDSLQSISSDEFLKKFDEKNLEFVYQDSTATGGLSRFNKFVDRGSTQSTSGSRTRTAGE